ncbi:hypothetical protein Q8A67_010354 [Cirrhinus molitorella]|uniref:SUEL-type lectin domain-containing protein n=1 Tax=Cirrhinus molitorella TaxID=172907 RepID=A0AA88TQD2_9TELE|nr:hypothetical protein Q8A67_010354 [Cirrhinus molitorella]
MFSLSVLLLTLLLLNSRLLTSADTVVTCDGPFVQRLSCDTGVISVQSAMFGRTSSLICSIGRPPSETSNTQCSTDVPAVSKRCNGLRECEINTQELAPRDPCFGTYKYYTTDYICIPAETSVTCHSGYGYLKCENGKIQINTANYGRTDKTTCSEGRPSNELQNTDCYSPNALTPTVVTCDGDVQRLSCDIGVISVQSATFGRTSSQICSAGRPPSETSNTKCSMDVPVFSKRCNGLRECEINTLELSTSDPCYGTYKYYTTNYICIPAETSVTCHYGYSYLKCENGRIQINTANYGRTDKTTCSEGRPSVQLQNTNCYSPNALAPVSKSCNGLESCEVFATHMVFTDPCVGTYKYLTISYFCLPPAVRSNMVCEHETSTLTCDNGTVIRIHSANYGRTDGTTCCAGRPATELAKTDCYALNSQTVVASGCEGKNSCSILASNSVFSDPCVGTFKYLYISYSCVSKCKTESSSLLIFVFAENDS